MDHITDTLKVSVWWGLLHSCSSGSFFSAKATVTSNNCLAMMENTVYPHLQEMLVPCSSGRGKRPQAWQCKNLLISISKADGLAVPVHSLGHPDHWLTHTVISSYEDMQKTTCNKHWWPTFINNLKNRIQAVIAKANIDMMQHTLMELKYHLDTVCLRKWCQSWMCVMFRTTNFVRGFVTDDAQTVCLWLSIWFLFPSKLMNIISAQPV